MSSDLFLYERYIEGLSAGTSFQKGSPPRGGSPFSDDMIVIDRDGNFTCQRSGLQGSPEEFLRKLYPYLTDEGLKRAVQVEISDEFDLNKARVESELKHFRSECSKTDDFEIECGIDPENVLQEPLWLDDSIRQLNYVQMSPLGYPVCRITWRPNERKEEITGALRVEISGDPKRIWFVEDCLQAVLFQQLIQEPVFLRPNEQALKWNDYERLVSGRDVVCIQGDDVGDFTYTSYPFINLIASHTKSLISLRTMPLTAGRSFVRWLNPETCKQLLREVEKSRVKTLRTYDRAMYHSYIESESNQPLHFPQDCQMHMYWYGTKEGLLVHSNPINILESKEAQKKKCLKVVADRNSAIQQEGLRLTKAEFLNIRSSQNQLKPRRTYEQLKALIDRHIYFSDHSLSGLVALYVIGGYLYKLFPAYGYLRLNGEAGTGKTTLLNIIAECGFNGTLQSQITKAGLAETVHNLSCTICLDEVEKRSIAAADEYVQLLKAGYKSDGSYSKMSGKNMIQLNVYSPKAIASIDPLGDEALDSRTLTIKTVLKPPKVELQEWDIDIGHRSNEVITVRRGCYAFGLFHHQVVEKLYRKLPKSIRLPSGMVLENRRRQIVAPLLAIAQLIDTNEKPVAESCLLNALDAIWNPDHDQKQARYKLLHDSLSQWSKDEAFTAYREKDGLLYIVNDCWEGTPVAMKLGGKKNTLKWFDSLPGVKKGPVYLGSELETKSCTGFPLDLKVHKRTVREIFSRKLGS